MKNSTTIFVVALILFTLGIGVGVFLENRSGLSAEMSMEGTAAHHAHEAYTVQDGTPVPSVSVAISADPESGWNMQLTTVNFAFTPENAGTDSVLGEGHAHLYINGEKKARVYGEWYHIPNDWLQSGSNQVRVTLNANDHSEYTYNGNPIEDTIVIPVEMDNVSN